MREMSTVVVEESRTGHVARAGLAVEHQSMVETGCVGSRRAHLCQARHPGAVECPRDAHAAQVQEALRDYKPLEQSSAAVTLEILHVFCLNLRVLTQVTPTLVAFEARRDSDFAAEVAEDSSSLDVEADSVSCASVHFGMQGLILQHSRGSEQESWDRLVVALAAALDLLLLLLLLVLLLLAEAPLPTRRCRAGRVQGGLLTCQQPV